MQIVVPEDIDTDTFGTFTREIDRAGNQLEAARKKARAAMDLTGLDAGLASEGSFVSNPSLPFLVRNTEIIVYLDDRLGIEVVGHHTSPATNALSDRVTTVEEALAFARSVGFPAHGIIARFNERSVRGMTKGINDEERLRNVVAGMLRKPLVRSVFLETDMRAHHNPTRMENIAAATKDLVANLKSACPSCGCPGFVIREVKRGLPCEYCKLPTQLVLAEIRSCQRCNFQQERQFPEGAEKAPQEWCGYCNP